jgi:hypothetical protein
MFVVVETMIEVRRWRDGDVADGGEECVARWRNGSLYVFF